MNKEELIALGLTAEQADKVIAGYGNTIPKSRFDEVNTAKKQLEKDIASRDQQLEELKKVDAAGLQAKIAELQQENTTAKEQYEKELKETQLSSAIKLALAGKVHDAGIAIRELDTTKIELDDKGNVKAGLDEQLKTLQESKSFLFVPEKKGQTFTGWNPMDGNAGDKGSKDFGSNFAKIANEKLSSGSNENNPWG